MFLTINTNAMNNEGNGLSVVTQLQRSLDNSNGNLTIGLVRLDYVIGYRNITSENAIVYYRNSEGGEEIGNVPEGLYNLSTYEDTLKDILRAETINIKPLKHNGRLEVRIKRPYSILKRENSASSVLCFNSESVRKLIAGKNISDTVPSFLTPKAFNIFLNGVDPTQNYVDGKFSTLLASVPCRVDSSVTTSLIQYSLPSSRSLTLVTLIN